jgi:hypothetical protein
MPTESAMSMQVMAFFTIVAALFVAGFASGPAIARKLGPSRYQQRDDHRHAH